MRTNVMQNSQASLRTQTEENQIHAMEVQLVEKDETIDKLR